MSHHHTYIIHTGVRPDLRVLGNIMEQGQDTTMPSPPLPSPPLALVKHTATSDTTTPAAVKVLEACLSPHVTPHARTRTHARTHTHTHTHTQAQEASPPCPRCEHDAAQGGRGSGPDAGRVRGAAKVRDTGRPHDSPTKTHIAEMSSDGTRHTFFFPRKSCSL